MRLKGKVALITGGASGLGLATGALMAREGAGVCIMDISEDGKDRALAAVQRAGGKAVFVKGDVSKSEDARRAVARTVEAFGRLDILFNNAGVSEAQWAPGIENLPEDDWDRVVDINMKGVYLCSKYAIPEIRKGGGGAIINNSSVAGFVAMPPHAYGAAKAGVLQLTRTLAVQLARERIRVNAVAPCFIDTPLLRGVYRGADLAEQERRLADLAKRVPMRHVGEPDDVAYAVLYLASDESKYITGQTLVIDGGYTSV